MIVEKSNDNLLAILRRNSFSVKKISSIEIDDLKKEALPVNRLVAVVENNWWIYLMLAAQNYYYKILSVSENLVGRFFFPACGDESLLCAITTLFSKVGCSLVQTSIKEEAVFDVQVCGISDGGETLLNHLKQRHPFAKEIADFYCPQITTARNEKLWAEPLYRVGMELGAEITASSEMNALLCNPYFRALDVTPMEMGSRYTPNFLRHILAHSKNTYIYTNKISDTLCVKSLIWVD